jgi:hypothetical protein
LTERANTFDQGAVLREFAAAAAQGSQVDTVRVRPIGSPAATTCSRRSGDADERGARQPRSALIESATGRIGEGAAQLDRRRDRAGDRR